MTFYAYESSAVYVEDLGNNKKHKEGKKSFIFYSLEILLLIWGAFSACFDTWDYNLHTALCPGLFFFI